MSCEQIAAICVALHAQDQRAGALPELAQQRVITTSGAEQRSGSVLAGLEALSDRAAAADWVLVHDAARPCVRTRDIHSLIDAVVASGVGGILAQPVVDTLKEAGSDALVARTVDRRGLWRAQTPQMFRLGELRTALRQAAAAGSAVTDEASAMELAGHPVQLVACGPHNMKVTVAEDLPLAGWYLDSGAQ